MKSEKGQEIPVPAFDSFQGPAPEVAALPRPELEKRAWAIVHRGASPGLLSNADRVFLATAVAVLKRELRKQEALEANEDLQEEDLQEEDLRKFLDEKFRSLINLHDGELIVRAERALEDSALAAVSKRTP